MIADFNYMKGKGLDLFWVDPEGQMRTGKEIHNAM